MSASKGGGRITRQGRFSRGRVHHLRRETVAEQARRAGLRGWEETNSAARLAAVWAERDAEIEARLGGTAAMSYRFKCRHCGSQFSLQQQKDTHEGECGKVGATEKASGKTAPKGIPCKRCQARGIDIRFPNIAEQMRHVRAEHAEDFRAKHSAGIRQRRAELKKIDAAISSKQAGEAPAASPRHPRRPAPAIQPNGATCPTCGGQLPATTAQLVHELTAAGIPEAQAFEAARIARRILGAGAAALS